ncbi:MAG TPA: hypothetical protein P5205_09085 [Candidatus Paceibacterota bacterium]|nr:hypothetical protein [Verrucomicrobiota bacterium]HSA10509.1 hypothetical protein [Candidatus Paceibacterota bacterium]
MADKVQMLKLLLEMRGFAQISNRRPPPRIPGAVLTQIRAREGHDHSRRRKLSISFNKQAQPAIPLQVKINHVKPNQGTGATLQAP